MSGKKLLCGDYTQYTPTGKSLFVKAGRYGKVPHAGDIVYFYSKNMGRVCHVGIVIDVVKADGAYRMTTVEGNTSSGDAFNRNGGCVAIKKYTVAGSQIGGGNRIDGFGTPKFGADTCDAAALIAVAKAEVGYLEKASNHQLQDKLANVGDKNYTKYGAWYGGNGLYWCQQFVSWVAHTACKQYQKDKAKNNWIQEGKDWYYRDESGELVKDAWRYINGRWYVFDGAGQAIKGWFKQAEDWYYLNITDYAMLSGQWITLDGKQYYLSKTGVMAASAWIRQSNGLYCFVNEKGEYRSEYDTYEPDLEKYELVE